jgi:hypothetical protein
VRPEKCENCGSMDFHLAHNKWICDYCLGEYEEMYKIYTHRRKNPPHGTNVFLWIPFIFIAVIIALSFMLIPK